nr:MAG: major capsid protein [Microvirus sp.]
MATIFDGVSGANPQRSTFDLSHDRKFTMKAGNLTPIFCKEVLPGDSFDIGISSIVRLIPMVGPTMHKLDMDVHFFYCPNRILWQHWEKFITGSKLAGAEAGTVPTHPYLDLIAIAGLPSAMFTVGTLADHLGYPVTDSQAAYLDNGRSIKVNSLPFRAYALIWKEYYRDQNLISFDDEWESIWENDGNDQAKLSVNFGSFHKRAWEKDYFTSALPFVQKGDPLTIPLGGTAKVISDGNMIKLRSGDGSGIAANADILGGDNGGGNPITWMVAGANPSPLEFDNQNTGLVTDLSGATAATINDLRAAFQAQMWLERNARAGTRYIESLESHFGVRPADYRLQRPELFGASRMPIQMSEVLQTSETANSPQGNMAGHGIGFDKDRYHVFCPEHGWIIGIASIKPRTSYMTAVNKSIFRLDYLDYYWPEFARLGEQAVLRKELGWFDGLTEEQTDSLDEVFGYQSRYAEYRSQFSTVHGGMRIDPVLKSWHMARENVNYATNLNKEFVESDPTTRIFADMEADYEYIVHSQFNVRAKRPLPFFADPGLIDHS